MLICIAVGIVPNKLLRVELYAGLVAILEYKKW